MKDISGDRGASALVLSGELTEGVSDLHKAMTAPGGVPALPEVNQDRSNPDHPEIEEQPHADFRRLVHADSPGHSPGAWTNVSPESRGPEPAGPGPATLASARLRHEHERQRPNRTGVK